MTDLPPDPLDDLASAHLDGVTTPEEEARLAADPALQARVEAMRAVRTAVASVPDADEGERAATVAAVLARLDQGATVTPLAPVRRERSRAWRIVAVAAAAIAVAVLIPVLAHQDHSDSQLDTAAGDSSATVPADSPASPEAAQRSVGNEATTSRGEAPTTTTIAAGLPDLGDFASVAALEAAVGDETGGASFYANEDQAVVDLASTCPEVLATRPSPTSIGRAHLEDRPVLVVTYGGTGILVLDPATCAIVDDHRP